MVALTSMDVPFVWQPACATAFTNLQDVLVRALNYDLCLELRFLWNHRNNLSADANGVIWRKRSSPGSQLQLLVPRPAREQLFLAYHASLFAHRPSSPVG